MSCSDNFDNFPYLTENFCNKNDFLYQRESPLLSDFYRVYSEELLSRTIYTGNDMLKALPTEVPDMEILDYVLLMQIKEMAAGMSKEEILETFSIDSEDFDDNEKIYFAEFYRFGKGMAIHKVINNLIESTRGKNGQPAAMAYLRRFASEFEKEVEGDSSGEFSFTFGNPKPPLKAVS